jgi:hypothetical protein
MMRIALFLIATLVSVAASSQSLPEVMDGDIIFQTSRSSQSLAIEKATHSRYSHMGVIFKRDGKPYVLEASATVRFTPLNEWIARGKDGAYVVKRLRTGLTQAQIDKLRKAARPLEGRSYDLTFEWSDARIYCSELVWKIYDRALDVKIGKLQRLADFDLSDPAVRAKMKERYGSAVPMDETVISPGVMCDSPLLQVVAKARLTIR